MARPVSTNKFLVAGMVFGIALLAFAQYQIRYPAAWDEIKLGMSRAEVYTLAGNPSQSTGDIKGDFWFVDKTTQQHELHTFFEDEKVTSVYVLRRVGTKHHFRNFYIRDESVPPIPTVTYCQLRGNWQHFDGKTVRVETRLYWFQHGYYFFDEACSNAQAEDPSLIDDNRTAVSFEEIQRETLWNQLQNFPHNRFSSPIAMIAATGRFTRRFPGLNRSDAIGSRTSFHFEINRIEKAVQSE